VGRIAKSKASGVTLIELMVTVAVLAIVMAIAVPSFGDIIDKSRLRGAVDDAISLISNARVEAVKADRDVRVRFGGATGNWCVGANAAVEPAGGNPVDPAAACDCTNPSQCQVGGQQLAVLQGAHSGVAVSTVNVDFTFSSKLGLISPLGSATATFTSPSTKYDMRMVVDALGHASACVPSGKPTISGVPSC